MSGGSLGLRTGSYGSLQLQQLQQQLQQQQQQQHQNQQQQNGFSNIQPTPILLRKPSKLLLSREKEKLRPFLCRFHRKFAVLLLVVLALFVFVFGSFTVSRGLLIVIFSVFTIFFFLAMKAHLVLNLISCRGKQAAF